MIAASRRTRAGASATSAGLVGLVGLLALLAGCGSPATHLGTAKKSYHPFGNVTGSVTPEAMVSVDSCQVMPGPVRATGTAKNPGSAPRDLVVTVRWLLPGTGRTLARGVAHLDAVAPGATVNWSVSARVPGRATAECLPTASVAGPDGSPSGDPGGSP